MSIFALVRVNKGINELHIIAFTHRNLSVNEIGLLHIDVDNQEVRLKKLKETLQLKELMFLSTCNRVEFLFTTEFEVNSSFLEQFFTELYPTFSQEQIKRYAGIRELHQGMKAVSHQLSVASSLDSMIVGEREIITQVRNAYDASKKMGLSGDFIRIVNRHTIQTAKKVYTETAIARKPVSVVSLAYHRLKDMNVPLDSRILIIGAGVTNTNMGRFLKKHGFTSFNVFNRALSKAEKLAHDLSGTAHSLAELKTFDKGFDVIITCTASESHIISTEIYAQLLQGEKGNKIVIDIAIPQDLSPKIKENNPVTHISVELLQKISNENLKERAKEVIHVEDILNEALTEFEFIHHNRSVEIAMREVPKKVKEIKSTAMNEVFHNELNDVDAESRELIEKIVGYMEKKYMSMPMLMAKEILLKK
ncbi:MAG: glutamyl-tRNA reductase [Fluviicola sp.]|nr:glutamyl-tRNA reductase [Fluviicola sp.]